MKVIPTEIDGVMILEPKVFGDARGYFFESWNEAALAEALDRGSIAGAALDVFSREPFAADSPLLGIREPDRLLLSPHNAWSPREAVDVLVGCVEENIKTFYGND